MVYELLLNMSNKGEYTNLNVKVPTSLKEQIRKALKQGLHMNMSDFVRIAIREKLAQMGITNSETIT